MRVEKTTHGAFIGTRAHTKKRSALERLSCLPSHGFSSTFERSLFYDTPNTLALKGLSSATHSQPVLEEKLQERVYPATNLKSARTSIPTNFYADELIHGEPQIEN